jgi:hypothetical protein
MLRVLAQSSAQPNGLRRKARQGVACVYSIWSCIDGMHTVRTIERQLCVIGYHVSRGVCILLVNIHISISLTVLLASVDLAWFCKPGARPRRLEAIIGLEPPRVLLRRGRGRGDRASPPRVQGRRHRFSAAKGRGGADRARSRIHYRRDRRGRYSILNWRYSRRAEHMADHRKLPVSSVVRETGVRTRPRDPIPLQL